MMIIITIVINNILIIIVIIIIIRMFNLYIYICMYIDRCTHMYMSDVSIMSRLPETMIPTDFRTIGMAEPENNVQDTTSWRRVEQTPLQDYPNQQVVSNHTCRLFIYVYSHMHTYLHMYLYYVFAKKKQKTKNKIIHNHPSYVQQKNRELCNKNGFVSHILTSWLDGFWN